MKYLMIMTLLWFSTLVLAHSPNRAYFDIQVKENAIVVNAEFPWTIREALMNYDSQLGENADEQAITQALECYFMDNFIIRDENGGVAAIQSLRILPHRGHSHQANVEVVYEHVEASLIVNTLMFDIFLDQKNIHKIETKEGMSSAYSQHKCESFELNSNSTTSLFSSVLRKFWQ